MEKTFPPEHRDVNNWVEYFSNQLKVFKAGLCATDQVYLDNRKRLLDSLENAIQEERKNG